MRMNIIVFLALTTHAAQAQAVGTDVQIALTLPQATCTLVVQEDVNFGTTMGPNPVIHLSADASLDKKQSFGRFFVTGKNIVGYMVSIDFPDQITGPGGLLIYEGQWSQTKNRVKSFETIAGQTLHQSVKGAFERFFRVGGRIRGLSANTKPGLYVGQISITTTCT